MVARTHECYFGVVKARFLGRALLVTCKKIKIMHIFKPLCNFHFVI